MSYDTTEQILPYTETLVQPKIKEQQWAASAMGEKRA